VTHALRTPSHNESEARKIASRQFGLIEHQQACKFLSDAAIGRRLKAKLWERVMPRVYRIAGAPTSRKQSAMAAVLWGGDGALVSHGTAALLWDFAGARGQKVELWVPPKKGVRSSLVIVHRGQRLDRADRTLLGPIPITTPVRTLIDIAGRLEDDRLLAVTEDVIRRGLATADRIYARLHALRTSGRTGGGRLEALLDARGDCRPLESSLETLAWPIICSTGVPLPVRQHWVMLPGGRYRLDFAWPNLKIGLECEGHAFHGTRSAWGKDRARFAEFAAAGWRVLPVTWDACSRDPQRVARWIKAALANAA
jgi:very-short-patch-repair endonuclease